MRRPVTLPVCPAHRALQAVVLAAFLLNCRGVTESRNFAACPQTYEFGNYGCAAIAGQVRGAQNQPLAGISVAPRPSADGGQFNTPSVATDGNGRFQLHLTRYAHTAADSARVWVRATIMPTPAGQVPTVFDSVLVAVKVAPVGEVPDTAHVVLVLPVP